MMRSMLNVEHTILVPPQNNGLLNMILCAASPLIAEIFVESTISGWKQDRRRAGIGATYKDLGIFR